MPDQTTRQLVSCRDIASELIRERLLDPWREAAPGTPKQRLADDVLEAGIVELAAQNSVPVVAGRHGRPAVPAAGADLLIRLSRQAADDQADREARDAQDAAEWQHQANERQAAGAGHDRRRRAVPGPCRADEGVWAGRRQRTGRARRVQPG